jgi:hypothetical protein
MARYPGRAYVHQYGNLKVTVISKDGYYDVTVLRPLDGYEVTIVTLERTPMQAARSALSQLAMPRTDKLHDDPALRRATEELRDEAKEAMAQVDEYRNDYFMDGPPRRSYVHQYGELLVTVKHKGRSYEAHVLRPSDGYEVTIGTHGKNPLHAARWALYLLSNEAYGLDVPHSIQEEVLLRARKELGQDAADALADAPKLAMAGWFPERPLADKGDVWFEVVYYPSGIPPGSGIAEPFPGKQFATQKEAETALWGLYEEGEITPQNRHLFGVEQCTQGQTPTHVGRVRVA